MSDELEDNLLAEIRPVFPQLSENLIRTGTRFVRGINTNADHTVTGLLPACIDFFLDMPQEIGNNLVQDHVANRFNDNKGAGYQLNNINNEVKTVEGICAQKHSTDFGGNSFDEYIPVVNGRSFDSNMRNGVGYNLLGSSSSSASSVSPNSSFSSNYSEDSDDENKRQSNDLDNSISIKSSHSDTLNGFQDRDVPLIYQIDPFEAACSKVVSVIPDVDKTFVLNWLKERFSTVLMDPGQLANSMLEHLFENPNSYPKLKEEEAKSSKADKANIEQEQQDIDYFSSDADCHLYYDAEYYDQCLLILRQIFRTVSTKDIRSIVWKQKSFAKAWKVIAEKTILNKNKEVASPFKPLNHPRPRRPLPEVLHPQVAKERDFVNSYIQKQSEVDDHKTALSLNFQQYEEEGQLIECGCCFGDVAFEQVTQCIEGHLFCTDCLRNYAHEAIYGSGKMQLFCMTSDCTSTFPISQLRKALDENMLQKYQERLQEESISMAELPDLVKCPFCDFAAEVPMENKVFKCQNPTCSAETCRHCKEIWADHFGIPCNEVERKSEKNVRTTYEEKMTMAKIRTCEKCGCGFMKTDGCNKMTCRCGTTMCYICRKSRIGYGHFCNHPRDPGEGCDKCKKCSLWSDPSEDDERAIKELKEEALREAEKVHNQELQTSGPALSGRKRPLSIGPQDEEQNGHRKKKKKRHHYAGYH